MKKLKQNFAIMCSLFLTVLIAGCNQDAAPSLYQEESKGSTPVISSTSPALEALAGVSEVTINGSNFSTKNEDNFVFFGTSKATVISSASNKLVVKAPNLVKNNLDVKIAVAGAENFSNVVKYNLLEAVGVYYAFTKGVDDPMAVEVDKNENLYVYLKDKGIKKISSDGKLTDWAPKGGESFYVDMKIGPNNELFGARPATRAIFRNLEGAAGATFQVFPTGITIASLDFDKNKNIWAAGTGNKMYSVTYPAKDTTGFSIDFSVTSVRVYNDYLYLAGKSSTEEAVYRYKINSNRSLGTKEKYFDIGAKYGLGKINVSSITFSADGDLILGTDQTDSMIFITSGAAASTLYPGLISGAVKSLSWGTKKNLFYVREYTEAGAVYHSLIRVDMQKLSASYYGRL